MKIWLLLSALVLEGISIYMVIQHPVTTHFELYALAYHTLACVSLSAACWLMMPTNYQYPLESSMGFLFIFNWLLPVIGMLGTLGSLMVALHLPRKVSNVTWRAYEENPLPKNPKNIPVEHLGVGALREILLYDSDPERHLLAISAIRNLPNKYAVPMLQLATKDLSDDVRLQAYASLERIETEINESISLLKKQFEHKATAHKAYELAQQYWELCYLGIAEGVLIQLYLKQAEQYLTQANKIQESASSNLLLGRVFLKQKRPLDAILVLNSAKNQGAITKQVAPYLAEAAYMIGNYRDVRHFITYFPDQHSELTSQIREYWK
ncbi:HEAT repeat domain-containing protein [Vibrio sp. 947]|uniref:HEAT repeat domain-containing protein n=1 Tax=Vibrio TaxID=662 RepID=UPI001CDBDD7F|nr:MULTISPECIES: HEAT repeat domain-containing protein [Vibrio]MCA2422599.1 HEAT repeat domain-containing protein [Vibrio alginolyticus]MCA2447240.1 HEAT repeat domain-containing protein [Vibrio alginolyticus]MDW1929378.1 HEAT repeat domain-containing protein [Vibrio sp. 947]MDW1948098.1 HEAT repeat domain-containing protein [Vibrio sp. 812(2023)]MDW1990887.1 HEAT repeat domain-containing protein [Vibrio sp. 780]